MPTNDERREVAQKLRYVGEHGGPEWATTACCIAECIGEDDYPIWDSSSKLFTKLADLIEPEPERTCSVEEHAGSRGGQWAWFYNFSCGHAFDSYWYMHPRYCPFCGAKSVDNAD